MTRAEQAPPAGGVKSWNDVSHQPQLIRPTLGAQGGFVDREKLADLEELPNVGPAVAAKLRRIDVLAPSDLVDRDPYALFDELNARTGMPHDPCLLDVFIASTRFMSGEPATPWWSYTAERKAALASASVGSSGAQQAHPADDQER